MKVGFRGRSGIRGLAASVVPMSVALANGKASGGSKRLNDCRKRIHREVPPFARTTVEGAARN